MLSVGITTSSGSKRPKSAGVFPSANRKLIAATGIDNSQRVQVSISKQTSCLHSHSSRCPKPPLNSATKSPRPRPCSAALQLWRQPGKLAATRHKSIVQRVVREEIDEQRHVTLEAQRQLHELQTTIARRQEELHLAQRHLHAFDPVSGSTSGKPGTLASVDENAVKAKPDIVSSLKQEIAHQDAYKKRLRALSSMFDISKRMQIYSLNGEEQHTENEHYAEIVYKLILTRIGRSDSSFVTCTINGQHLNAMHYPFLSHIETEVAEHTVE
ncbi:Uncharacterized protein PHPALM_10921 [Phytophthora palmivora]|uniref:Uncharacterized protein n=1 Tax=Phytophthora palmivora TaxID=4796 RepID=A0A2P4Y3W2_9STRA|nr:Uncharacterized protein PHPALM_10921 [Phytophthora palmivora]